MKKKLLPLLTALFLCLCLLPTALAENAPVMVSYLDDNGTTQTQTFDTYTEVKDAENATWNDGVYVVSGDTTISGTVTVTEGKHAVLVLRDGAKLTVTDGIEGLYDADKKVGASLTVYTEAGSETVGELTVETKPALSKDKVIFLDGGLTVNGGIVTAEIEGNNTCGLSLNGNGLTVNGGHVVAKGYEGIHIQSNEGMTVKNGGVVTATGAVYGIYDGSDKSLSVIGNSTLTATATNGDGCAIGGSINAENSTLNLSGKTLVGDTDNTTYTNVTFEVDARNELEYAMKQSGGNTIKLVGDIDLSDETVYVTTNCKTTLDLNGHHILGREEGADDGRLLFDSNQGTTAAVDFTVTDSSEAKNGSVKTLQVEIGKVTVESGTVKKLSANSATIAGGKIEDFTYNSGSLTATGGTISKLRVRKNDSGTTLNVQLKQVRCDRIEIFKDDKNASVTFAQLLAEGYTYVDESGKPCHPTEKEEDGWRYIENVAVALCTQHKNEDSDGKCDWCGLMLYLDENGETKTLTSDWYTAITANDKGGWNNEDATGDNWYVVTGNLTLSGERTDGMYFYGDNAHLILCDGATLTVNGSIHSGGTNLHIYAQSTGDKQGKLVVNGVQSANDGDENIGIYLNSPGSLTVNGGEVTVTSADSNNSGSVAIEVQNLTIHNGTVTATGGKGTTGWGVKLEGDLTMTGGKLTARGGQASNNSYGIALKNLVLSDCVVDATGGSGKDSYGIHWSEADKANEIVNSTVTATGGTTNGGNSYGFQFAADPDSNTTLTVTNSNVTATGGNATGGYSYSCGINFDGKTLTVNGGKVTATGGASVSTATGDESGSESNGIYLQFASLVVRDGTLTAKGGTATGGTEGYSNGIAMIDGDKSLTVSGGTVIAIGGEADTMSCGIKTSSNSVAFSGGTITATGDSGEYSYGIYVNQGDLTVSGEKTVVTVTSGDANDYSIGINVEAGNLTLNGATVTATGGMGEDSNGVRVSAGGDHSEIGSQLTVTAGKLTATGGVGVNYSYGITVEQGNLTLNGGTITATGGTSEEQSVGVEVTPYYTASENSGKLTVTAGKLTADGGVAKWSFGMRADKLAVSGGEVVANGGKSTGTEYNVGYGIEVDSLTTVSGGKVIATSATETAEGGRVEDGFVTDFSLTNLTVSGGEIKLTEGSQVMGYLKVENDITLRSLIPETCSYWQSISGEEDGTFVVTDELTELVGEGTDEDGNPVEYDYEVKTCTHSYEDGECIYCGAPKPPSSSSNTITTVTTKPDGTTTTTTTNKKTGETTEVTKHPDGSTTTTVTDKDGNVTEITVSVSDKDSQSGETVKLPVDEVTPSDKSENAPTIKIEAPKGETTVEIPVKNPTAGTVIVVVDEDGNETVISNTKRTENGLSFVVSGNVTVKVVDRTVNFADVPEGEFYTEAVAWASSRGITTGMTETLFGVNEECNRAQLVTFLWRAAGRPTAETTVKFTDVPDGEFYTEAVQWAASVGIVEGYGDGTFGVNDTVTREQVATILYRYEQSLGGGFTGAWAFRLNFEDVAEISEWAFEGISWCVMNGIMQGYEGYLTPQAPCNRAQIVTMLYRYMTK